MLGEGETLNEASRSEKVTGEKRGTTSRSTRKHMNEEDNHAQRSRGRDICPLHFRKELHRQCIPYFIYRF